MRKNLTEIVFILDRSGSMSGLEADTIGGFNSMIEKQKKENGEALISTVLFDNVSEVIHDRVPVQKVEPMTDNDYSVRGCTALLDAIGGAIHHIGNVHKYARNEDVPEHKALDIYASACGRFGVMPKTNTAKLLVEQAISQLQTTSAALAALKQEMQSLAASLPEYPVVMEMFGVGPTLGPQLIAEIGDVRRFHSKKALVAFAGIDAPPYQSGQIDVRSRSISKRGSASLRRTLFLVMGVLLQCAPMDEPVYQFMNKKRSEGKPYRVYMMASANKFLRIYYASVKAYLDSLEHD